MNNRSKEIIILVLVAVLWFIYRIVEYYLVPYFIAPFLWLWLSVGFLIIVIYQLIKLIRERKNIKTIQIIKTIFYGLLFYFTLNRWLVENVIEKADWHIFYKKRMEIVEKVRKKELNPNTNLNNGVCELPFKYPIISHSGNDIIIGRNDSMKTITVEFFTFRNFFEAPSTFFIYTNDEENIKYYDARTKGYHSKHNWKIEENWYRIMR